MYRFSVRILTALLGFSCVTAAAVAGDVYKQAGEIPIGGEGGWDILTIDSAAHRLYLSHATKVVVVDTDSNKVVGEIADTPGVHEFLAVPALQRGFASNGKDNSVSIVDLKTLRAITKIPTGDGPDAMAYDDARHELYVGNHHGNSITVIDAAGSKAVATIELPGSPEFSVIDSAKGAVYCNIEDKNEVAVIDESAKKVVATWALAPAESPTGIALDSTNHRLFSTCHKVLTMLDTESGKLLASIPIGSGADGCAFDAASGLIFASCGEGLTMIAKAEDRNRLTNLQTLKTERGARTIALDPKTHRIFLPTAQFQPAPSPAPGASPTRPVIVPNTLKLLVYEPVDASTTR